MNGALPIFNVSIFNYTIININIRQMVYRLQYIPVLVILDWIWVSSAIVWNYWLMHNTFWDRHGRIFKTRQGPSPPPPPFEGVFNISYMFMFCNTIFDFFFFGLIHPFRWSNLASTHQYLSFEPITKYLWPSVPKF